MLNMLLKGYVSPDDFVGTDTEKLQKAFDASYQLNVGRVIVKGNYTVDKTIYIYAMTDLVLNDATICGTGNFPVLANKNFIETDKHSWSFQEQYLTIRGKGRFVGDVLIYNAFHVNIDGIEFAGALRFAFTNEVRLYNSKFTGNEGVVLTGGTNNFIMQNLVADCKTNAIVMDGTTETYDYVIGKDPDIHDIILQDSELNASDSAIVMNASLNAKIYNMQLDHIVSKGVTLVIGKKGENVPEECYFNLTGEHFISSKKDAIILNNHVKHCYFPKP